MRRPGILNPLFPLKIPGKDPKAILNENEVENRLLKMKSFLVDLEMEKRKANNEGKTTTPKEKT